MTHKVFEDAATVKAWDENYYHPIAERYYDQAVANMLRLLGAGPGSEVLDAGCGPGVHSIRAARAGCTVMAIDISQTMLNEARERATIAGVASNISFQQADLTKLTLADASYSHVFSWGVIIHIHEADKALDELARVLKPGGRLGLYLTNSRALDHKLERLLRRVLRKPAPDQSLPLGVGRWYQMHGHQLWVWQFDVDALTRAMQQRGLKPVARVVGEFSEIQRRLEGPIRTALLHLNTVIFRLGIGQRLAVANLLVFEKA
jgi:SAM-dependent methyltransferase